MTPGAPACLPGSCSGWTAPTPAEPGADVHVYLGHPWQHISFGNQKHAYDSGKIATQIIALPGIAGLMISFCRSGGKP